MGRQRHHKGKHMTKSQGERNSNFIIIIKSLFVFVLGGALSWPVISKYSNPKSHLDYRNLTIYLLIIYGLYVLWIAFALYSRLMYFKTAPNCSSDAKESESRKLERVEESSQYLVIALSVALAYVSSVKETIAMPSGAIFLLWAAISLSGLIFLVYPYFMRNLTPIAWIALISSLKSVLAAAVLLYFISVLLNIRFVRNPIFL